jgi:glutaredoxin
MLHPVRVELYSKPGCSLCDKALAVLASVRGRVPFELVVVDISLSPSLYAAYRLDIPVVTVAGTRAFSLRVDAAELERLVVSAGGTPVAEPGDAE